MKVLSTFLLLLTLCAGRTHAQTFAEWFSQKKTQKKYLAKQILLLQTYLGAVKDGYKIAKDGLNIVGSLKNGEFNLHNNYFTSLSKISPAIASSTKAAEIGFMLTKAVNTYRDFNKALQSTSLLTAEEQQYCLQTISAMVDHISDNIARLTAILTTGTLQLTDEQRKALINTIHDNTTNASQAIFQFTQNTTSLISQRDKSLQETASLKTFITP